jgi:hypothetical protein
MLYLRNCNTLIICPPPPTRRGPSAAAAVSSASMATPRPRIRAVPFRPLLLFLLVPLIYSGTSPLVSSPPIPVAMPPLTIQSAPVSRLHPWAPEKGVCLPPPAAPKRPDRLVIGPAAGQGRPDRLQCQGAFPSPSASSRHHFVLDLAVPVGATKIGSSAVTQHL